MENSDEIVKEIEKNMLKNRDNGLLLSDEHIEILERYGFDYRKIEEYEDDLKFINDELKSKIWAMHINDKILEEKTKELGFNIVKVKKSLLIKKSSATNE